MEDSTAREAVMLDEQYGKFKKHKNLRIWE